MEKLVQCNEFLKVETSVVKINLKNDLNLNQIILEKSSKSKS